MGVVACSAIKVYAGSTPLSLRHADCHIVGRCQGGMAYDWQSITVVGATAWPPPWPPERNMNFASVLIAPGAAVVCTVGG